ncbi:hypothetical protein, partial [Sutterella wadsworthensis]
GEMQKPLAGLLSHFLRYVHGVDSVCVQKIHTTSDFAGCKKPAVGTQAGFQSRISRKLSYEQHSFG